MVDGSGVRNESDPALALLSEHVESPSHATRCGTCVGLGVAYAGARREDVVELLTPLVANSENANMVEVRGFVTLDLMVEELGVTNIMVYNTPHLAASFASGNSCPNLAA